MSAAKEKFLELLYHVDEWGLLEKEERSFLLQPLELVIYCNDHWAANLCYPLPGANEVTGIALNTEFFHDLYGDTFNADQLSPSECSNLVRFQVAYGGLLAKLRWRWGEWAMRYSDCFQDCDTDIALEIFSFGIMSKMIESECKDNLFVGLCRKWFSLLLFNFAKAQYDGDIYLTEDFVRSQSTERLYRNWIYQIKPLSDPEKSFTKLPKDVQSGIRVLRMIRDLQKQYPTLQRFLAGTDILKSIDVYQVNQSFFRNATIQKLEEENQELRDILLTRRPDTVDARKKHLNEIYSMFFPVITLGKAAKAIAKCKEKCRPTCGKICSISEEGSKKYLQRRTKEKTRIKVNKTIYYSIYVIIAILKNYAAIDKECRTHQAFNDKFEGALVKEALNETKFEEKFKGRYELE